MLSKLHEKIAGNLMVLFLSYNGSLGGLPRLSSRLLIVVTQMNPSEFKCVRYMPKALGSTSGEKLDTQDTPKSPQEIPRRSKETTGAPQETPGDPEETQETPGTPNYPSRGRSYRSTRNTSPTNRFLPTTFGPDLQETRSANALHN